MTLNMDSEVSVVIPTFNRCRELVRALRSLPKSVEIIVVDDGSTDDTRERVREFNHPQLTYVRKRNGGPASARNLGIERATGPIIAFTDDDCEPIGRWPWTLVERLKGEGPQVAGVGGRVLPMRKGLISRYYDFHRILEPPSSCSYLVTANCAYRKSVLTRVGGFNESLTTPGGEDPELSVRIRRLGFRFVFEPTAVIRHDFRESWVDFAVTFYRYGRGCSSVVG
jgi:glycosyltransferase involved in cell wall biosynthesis